MYLFLSLCLCLSPALILSMYVILTLSLTLCFSMFLFLTLCWYLFPSGSFFFLLSLGQTPSVFDNIAVSLSHHIFGSLYHTAFLSLHIFFIPLLFNILSLLHTLPRIQYSSVLSFNVTVTLLGLLLQAVHCSVCVHCKISHLNLTSYTWRRKVFKLDFKPLNNVQYKKSVTFYFLLQDPKCVANSIYRGAGLHRLVCRA